MSDTIYTETDQGAIDFTHEVLTDINNFLCRTDGRTADLDLGKECVSLVEDILSAALRHGLQLHPSTVARVFLRTTSPEDRRRFLQNKFKQTDATWAKFGRAVVESLKEEGAASDDIEHMAIQLGLYDPDGSNTEDRRRFLDTYDPDGSNKDE
jgi:hypothetical protein